MSMYEKTGVLPFMAHAPQGFCQTVLQRVEAAWEELGDDGDVVFHGWRHEEGDGVGGITGEGFYKGDLAVVVGEQDAIINAGDFIASEKGRDSLVEFAKDFGIGISTVGKDVPFHQVT
jgi:hypothetical protein